ncbi:hypothetical protein KIPB_006125 [Kipferlia bialata]|uniref:THH1/TOM1/TOM3 domain-containing protein n=1 Tax=Kipferlia bialata TaxID=797122 RepID=A0A9K3GHZ9_9EUKA|nr:hypothetical protein KIPB_006125 [Kipferlia bialata]|eukprot:g6125.t1
MATATYDRLWRQAMTDLLDQVQVEANYDSTVTILSPEQKLAQDTQWYMKYLGVYRLLEDCYDQMIHPQKRVVVRTTLGAVVGRLLECRSAICTALGTFDPHIEDILSDHKVSFILLALASYSDFLDYAFRVPYPNMWDMPHWIFMYSLYVDSVTMGVATVQYVGLLFVYQHVFRGVWSVRATRRFQRSVMALCVVLTIATVIVVGGQNLFLFLCIRAMEYHDPKGWDYYDYWLVVTRYALPLYLVATLSTALTIILLTVVRRRSTRRAQQSVSSSDGRRFTTVSVISVCMTAALLVAQYFEEGYEVTPGQQLGLDIMLALYSVVEAALWMLLFIRPSYFRPSLAPKRPNTLDVSMGAVPSKASVREREHEWDGV